MFLVKNDKLILSDSGVDQYHEQMKYMEMLINRQNQ